MDDISCSLLAYNENPEMVKKAIESFLGTELKIKLFLIDNSKNASFRNLVKDSRVEYISNYCNIGFGAAHNIGIKRSIDNFKYHLVLNPDVYFNAGTLEELFDFAEQNKEVGSVMPKILYPDGSLQYTCKLLPTPLDFFMRRFLSWVPVLKLWIEKKNAIFELRFSGYNRIMDVPALSGCFMFLRTEAIKKVGLFDERYFIYCEDFDLSRRIHRYYKTVFYPGVSIFHGYAKTSAKDPRCFNYHVDSTFKYFNKWGWFFDAERKRINKEILEKYMHE